MSRTAKDIAEDHALNAAQLEPSTIEVSTDVDSLILNTMRYRVLSRILSAIGDNKPETLAVLRALQPLFSEEAWQIKTLVDYRALLKQCNDNAMLVCSIDSYNPVARYVQESGGVKRAVMNETPAPSAWNLLYFYQESKAGMRKPGSISWMDRELDIAAANSGTIYSQLRGKKTQEERLRWYAAQMTTLLEKSSECGKSLGMSGDFWETPQGKRAIAAIRSVGVEEEFIKSKVAEIALTPVAAEPAPQASLIIEDAFNYQSEPEQQSQAVEERTVARTVDVAPASATASDKKGSWLDRSYWYVVLAMIVAAGVVLAFGAPGLFGLKFFAPLLPSVITGVTVAVQWLAATLPMMAYALAGALTSAALFGPLTGWLASRRRDGYVQIPGNDKSTSSLLGRAYAWCGEHPKLTASLAFALIGGIVAVLVAPYVIPLLPAMLFSWGAPLSAAINLSALAAVMIAGAVAGVSLMTAMLGTAEVVTSVVEKIGKARSEKGKVSPAGSNTAAVFDRPSLITSPPEARDPVDLGLRQRAGEHSSTGQQVAAAPAADAGRSAPAFRPSGRS
jgi:hypothetical protein